MNAPDIDDVSHTVIHTAVQLQSVPESGCFEAGIATEKLKYMNRQVVIRCKRIDPSRIHTI
jgi:hypothetical protein